MTKNGKIIIGISVAAIGYVLYKQYMSKKIDNAVKGIDNADAGTDTFNPAIASNCKNIATTLKSCQTPKSGKSIWTNFGCATLEPYQKICAKYI